MTTGKNYAPGHGRQIVELLKRRGAHAVEMEELKGMVEMPEKALWCSLGRLQKKGDVFRWQNELFKEYVVLTEHRHSAFYYQPARAVNSVFAAPVEVLVTRSVPFIPLSDDTVERRNRYAELVA